MKCDPWINKWLLLSENYSLNKLLTFFHQCTTEEWAINSIICPTSYSITNTYSNVSHKVRIFAHPVWIFGNIKCISDEDELIIIVVKARKRFISIIWMRRGLWFFFIRSLRLYLMKLVRCQLLRYTCITIVNTKLRTHWTSRI